MLTCGQGSEDPPEEQGAEAPGDDLEVISYVRHGKKVYLSYNRAWTQVGQLGCVGLVGKQWSGARATRHVAGSIGVRVLYVGSTWLIYSARLHAVPHFSVTACLSLPLDFRKPRSQKCTATGCIAVAPTLHPPCTPNPVPAKHADKEAKDATAEAVDKKVQLTPTTAGAGEEDEVCLCACACACAT